jgi:hypothetical protein
MTFYAAAAICAAGAVAFAALLLKGERSAAA